MHGFSDQPADFNTRMELSLQLKALAFQKTARQKELARHIDAYRRRQVSLALKYSPDQPRVPAGHPAGGQWTRGGGGTAEDAPILLADYSFGTLIAEFETGLGRRCVYRFSFGSIVVAGPDRLRCSTRVPSAAVTHGYFLNDN